MWVPITIREPLRSLLFADGGTVLPTFSHRPVDNLPDIPEPRQAAEGQIAYFETNSSRMTYAAFRSQGVFICSGIIEAGCKTVVAKRFKNSGMVWSLQGAQNILDLRTSLLSSRFDSQWIAKDLLAA